MGKKKQDVDSKAWLDSYSDMVTLLMTFFIVMLSMSNTDTEKVDAVLQSLRAAGIDTAIIIPIDQGGDMIPGLVDIPSIGGIPAEVMSMDTLYEVMSAYVLENDMGGAMKVTKNGELVHIQFSSAILFNPDSHSMLTASRPLLSFVGEILKLYDEKIRFINIGGHTARTGRASSGVSDWRLSGERAATVAMFLEDEVGIPRQKMVTIGYGDNYPIADNSTDAGRSQNRRVELVIVGTESPLSFDIYGVMSGAIQNDNLSVSVDTGLENGNATL